MLVSEIVQERIGARFEVRPWHCSEVGEIVMTEGGVILMYSFTFTVVENSIVKM